MREKKTEEGNSCVLFVLPFVFVDIFALLLFR